MMAQEFVGMSISVLISYIASGLWFFAMLALAGGALWNAVYSPAAAESGTELSRLLIGWQRIHLVALILVIVTHLEELLDGGGFEELPSLFITTRQGVGWLALLILSAIGLIGLKKRLRPFCLLWASALLAASTVYGNAASGDPLWATLLAHYIHLAAAAVCIGGLLLALQLYRQRRDLLPSFLQQYSAGMAFTVVALIATGIWSAWLLLPNRYYLLHTQWGILLIVKTAISLLLLFLAWSMRNRARRSKADSVMQMVKAQMGMLIIIVLIAGVIAHLAPVPKNKPLFWHEMGETIHMTARINPLYVGDNTFLAKVWIPVGEGEPHEVRMILSRPLNAPDRATIDIPLTRFEDPEPDFEFEGFAIYSYQAENVRIPDGGEWTLQVEVDKANGEHIKYEKEFSVK